MAGLSSPVATTAAARERFMAKASSRNVKIREIAEQHSIPIIKNKPLARSMHDGVDVDRAIQPKFYKSVAKIIHILYAKSPRKASAK